MGVINTHRDLLAWQEAMSLVTQIYHVTKIFPKEELFGLTSQMRRAAISIPSNIAEGAGRNGRKEFVQFLGVARGSLSELETQVLIACDLGLLKESTVLLESLDRLYKLISGLIKSLSDEN